MTFAVRVASSRTSAISSGLTRDVQRLRAEIEPSLFKSNFANKEVAAFIGAKLTLPENHIRLADSDDGRGRRGIASTFLGQVEAEARIGGIAALRFATLAPTA